MTKNAVISLVQKTKALLVIMFEALYNPAIVYNCILMIKRRDGALNEKDVG